MKIFSNFDTNLRQHTFAEYQEHYGIDNVLCFGRSKLYRIVKVVFPLLFLVTLNVLGLWFFYARLGGDYFTYIIVSFAVIDIVFFFPIIGKYLDYKMDFILVVPGCLIMYDQGGILKRSEITISSASIKTISIRKNGLLYSIFDNGDIIVLTEGDIQYGEVTLRWIPRPDKRRNQIAKIIGIDLEADQNPH